MFTTFRCSKARFYIAHLEYLITYFICKTWKKDILTNNCYSAITLTILKEYASFVYEPGVFCSTFNF